MKILYIVLTYSTDRKILYDNLKNLNHNEIMIINNFIKEKILEDFEKKFLKIINNTENTGYAGGMKRPAGALLCL
jgi:NDP-sugar pyrophosphorylase family protein